MRTPALAVAAALVAGPLVTAARAVPVCDPFTEDVVLCLDEYLAPTGIDLVQYCMETDPRYCS